MYALTFWEKIETVMTNDNDKNNFVMVIMIVKKSNLTILDFVVPIFFWGGGVGFSSDITHTPVYRFNIFL